MVQQRLQTKVVNSDGLGNLKFKNRNEERYAIIPLSSDLRSARPQLQTLESGFAHIWSAAMALTVPAAVEADMQVSPHEVHSGDPQICDWGIHQHQFEIHKQLQ